MDYQRLRESSEWQGIRSLTANLRQFNPLNLKRDDAAKAFWINLYNAMIIDAITELGIRSTVWEVPLVFSRVAYDVGGHILTADMIEHGILRANARPPYPLSGPYFAPGSSQLVLALGRLDPRIHFALVCGSKRCPPIGFYEETGLDTQLSMATRAFINAETVVDSGTKLVTTSSIFKYYADDFGGMPSGLSRFLASWLDNAKTAEWLREHAHSARFEFRRYDWSLNR
ncbi:MAG: DUF547 domain-containing protein [Deltaproteobacteria bacterium]|nr:DUF547 domain-containing protein [Deltaproteobacteria bacterium]